MVADGDGRGSEGRSGGVGGGGGAPRRGAVFPLLSSSFERDAGGVPSRRGRAGETRTTREPGRGGRECGRGRRRSRAPRVPGVRFAVQLDGLPRVRDEYQHGAGVAHRVVVAKRYWEGTMAAPRRAADAPSRAPRPARASTPRSTIESRGDDVRDAARRRGEPAAPETVESAESVRASSTRGVARDRRVRIGTLVKSRSESWTCRGRRPRSVFVTGVTSSHTWRRDRTPDPRLARARLETTF